MGKLFLIAGFVLALSTLGFAAANAGPPSAPVGALELSLD